MREFLTVMLIPVRMINHRRQQRKQLRRDFRSLLRIFKFVTKIGYPQSQVEALKLNRAIREYKEIMNRIDVTIIEDPEIYLDDFKKGGTDVVKLWWLKIKFNFYCWKILRNDIKIIKAVFAVTTIIGIPKDETDIKVLKKAINDYNDAMESMDQNVINNAKKYVNWFNIEEEIKNYNEESEGNE